MKALSKILIVLLAVVMCESAFAQNTVTNNIANFTLSNNGTKFSFDIFTLRTSSAPFSMGSTSFIVSYPTGRLSNPVLSNINPRYTSGSPSLSYNAMITQILLNSKVGVQINYTGGLGDTITSVPGTNGMGELIATVTLDIINPIDTATVKWDTINSAVVSPSFETAVSTWGGIYHGALPVEMVNFTSAIVRNNVKLSWTTAAETNNSGFEIERKSVENSSWKKVVFVEGSGTTHENRSYEFTDRGLNSGNYNYRIKQIDYNGNFEYFNLRNEVNIGVPMQYELSQNYPNPFNPATKINFSLPADARVTLAVYDISGRLISTLINNELRAASYHTVEFNASNLSSGTYFYSLKTQNFSDTKKMVVIK